jgi:prophage antirepressor-like protein
MTESISVFKFNSNSIRVVMQADGPWFVAKDVCEVLEIKNVADALTRLDSDETNTIVLNDGKRGNPTTAIISESGLYDLVLSSRKPEARPFRKWVTKVVLPEIRKTGSYSLTKGPHWMKARQDGKSARRTLTDAVNSYIERHPGLSKNARQWLYHNVSDELNMRLFGQKSKTLKLVLGLKRHHLLRDRLTEDQLINIHAVEAAAVRLIDAGDVQPIKAVQKVATECLFEGMYHHCYLEPAKPKENQLSLF